MYKKKAELNEINTLINKGISIEVERTITRKKSGIWGRFKPAITEVEKLTFSIKEPTLYVLDLMAAEQIELEIDEKVMRLPDVGIQEARRLAHKHGKRLAKILALAVLGQDYAITFQIGSRVKYEYDDYRLNELTELFFNNIKPSKLLDYVIAINTMSNVADFTNSIRLMSASRTTMPILIEQKD